ncbi:hypothetical protein GRJ2_000950900 [Grus japonensis]|uniref:Uncharacterized protein n=1 Tax=Grus japonensis TaxID=30415 RepID=A0ABC9WH93_GRUJA
MLTVLQGLDERKIVVNGLLIKGDLDQFIKFFRKDVRGVLCSMEVAGCRRASMQSILLQPSCKDCLLRRFLVEFGLCMKDAFIPDVGISLGEEKKMPMISQLGSSETIYVR